MAEADFRHGNPCQVDYTPAAAVAAGEVVVLGQVIGVAHLAIAADALGALAVGNGVYRVTGDGVIAAGKVVYWDNTNNKVTETASGNLRFGYTVSACGGDGQLCDVFHQPDGAAAAA